MFLGVIDITGLPITDHISYQLLKVLLNISRFFFKFLASGNKSNPYSGSKIMLCMKQQTACLFICGLFNYAASCLDCMASNGKMINQCTGGRGRSGRDLFQGTSQEFSCKD